MARDTVGDSDTSAGYYGLPVLKPPVWTWEVPVYFFVGGASGASAVIAAVAEWTGGDRELARTASWIAAGGGIASAALLTSDLGRPERFLNMLRVFKPQSPMSVGSWTLAAFSSAAAASACAAALDRRLGGNAAIRVVHGVTSPAAAMLGTVLSTYTGVLIGATAVPVWNTHVRVLPIQFGASGVASAVAVLELLGHRDDALNRLGVAAAAVETLTGVAIERRSGRASAPLREGPSGRLAWAGGILSGPVPLVCRSLAFRWPRLRSVAAVASIAGSLVTRFAWLAAGQASAIDPAVPLGLPAIQQRGDSASLPAARSTADTPLLAEKP